MRRRDSRPADAVPGRPLPRRQVLRGLATGLAGAVALPATRATAAGSDHAGHVQAASAAEPQAGETLPGLLDAHQREMLASLAEHLVPDSVAAGAIGLLDRVVAADTPEAQRELLNAIGVFEREAHTRHGARWLDLDAPAQLGILEAAAAMEPTRSRASGPFTNAPEAPPPPKNLRDHLDDLRDLVAEAYYATEPGLRELGWTGRTTWRELPDCTHVGDRHGDD